MKLEVKKIHIETDVFNTPKLIFTDENGQEWSLSHRPICYEGGGINELVKKDHDYYFDEKNKN